MYADDADQGGITFERNKRICVIRGQLNEPSRNPANSSSSFRALPADERKGFASWRQVKARYTKARVSERQHKAPSVSWGSGDDLIELAYASDRFSVLQAIAHLRGLGHLVSRGNPGAKETVSKLQRQLFKLPRPLGRGPRATRSGFSQNSKK